MKRLLFLLAALAISLPLFSQEYVGDSCTALLVGKKASSDGSVMTSHTCDPLPHLASPGGQILAPVRDGLLGGRDPQVCIFRMLRKMQTMSYQVVTQQQPLHPGVGKVGDPGGQGVPLPACPLGASHWVPCQRQNLGGQAACQRRITFLYKSI